MKITSSGKGWRSGNAPTLSFLPGTVLSHTSRHLSLILPRHKYVIVLNISVMKGFGGTQNGHKTKQKYL